ncbi:uridine phosphorylase 1-like isoform X2 [Rhipicephalus microplus]|uniref:uridine phosphorylase 1-like isoform X2 n=1 Tax=Rhipicephalus microplus TaxID=6941 RepID=UPI003F6BAF8D
MCSNLVPVIVGYGVKHAVSTKACYAAKLKLAATMPDDGSDMQDEGVLRLRNPHLSNMETDHLYHLALSTDTHDLQHMFGDLKFVCMGGTPARMQEFAHFVKRRLGIQLPTGAELYDISHRSYRYAMYKCGPVLSVSHGMGAPSLSILMHEILKLIHYARCRDVVLIRVGTSGGIGIPAGSVVVSTATVNGLLREELELHVLGEVVRRPCVLDGQLAHEIVAVGQECMADTNVVAGKTLSSNDFYEGQARLDGAICHYTEDEKMGFLGKLLQLGVVNIEMESSQFAAMCHHAGVKGAVVCVTLLDRMQGDQVTASKDVMAEWQRRPQELVVHFMARRLGVTLCV